MFTLAELEHDPKVPMNLFDLVYGVKFNVVTASRRSLSGLPYTGREFTRNSDAHLFLSFNRSRYSHVQAICTLQNFHCYDVVVADNCQA